MVACKSLTRTNKKDGTKTARKRFVALWSNRSWSSHPNIYCMIIWSREEWPCSYVCKIYLRSVVLLLVAAWTGCLHTHIRVNMQFRGQIHSPWLGDIVNSSIGLSYWPASQCRLAAAGQYDNPMPELTISPSQGLWIRLQISGDEIQTRIVHLAVLNG